MSPGGGDSLPGIYPEKTFSRLYSFVLGRGDHWSHGLRVALLGVLIKGGVARLVGLVLIGLVGLVLIGLVRFLGGARLWCGQLAAACHGLDVVGGVLLGPHRGVAQAARRGEVGDVQLVASHVVVELAGDALVAPARSADWAARRVHQCWQRSHLRLGCWELI